MDNKKSLLAILQQRWGLKSIFHVIVILIVFAFTGFTVLFIKNPLLGIIGEGAKNSWVFTTLYYLFILPIYQVILLMYAFLFGQFTFFWDFEKRTFRRIAKWFRRKKKP